jgi:DNA polymerase I
MEREKKLILIDGHAMLYRAWFAFPQSLTKRDGQIVNAVFGFTRILLSVINEMKPEYLAVSFDVGRTFRHDMYKDYKAHREKMPEELKAQEPLTYKVVEAMNIPVFTKVGFEADDVIGSLAMHASKSENLTTIIVTGDKDTFQLVSDPSASSGQVRVYMPGRGNKGPVLYDEAAVERDLGIKPNQVPDYKGLAGDPSDNIPGVRGVGKVTAAKLLREFGTVEELYEYLDKRFVIGDSRLEKTDHPGEKLLTQTVVRKLTEGKESAFESKKLATIVRDVPIELNLALAEVKQYDKDKVVEVFEEYGFQSLFNKLPGDSFETSVQEALF